jgi:subtilisin family serine protease
MASSEVVEPMLASPRTRLSSERELVVIVQQKVGLRVSATGLAASNQPFLKRLQEVLAASNGSVRPLFGADASRLRLDATAPPMPGARIPDLSGYYRIDAPDEQLEMIANKLRATDEVRAAYIKPAAEPASLNAMLPSTTSAPRRTPDFRSRQNYLDPSPTGIDAQYAWTHPGGKGKDVQIIDVEGEWRFSHEDLRLNKGGVVGGTVPNNQGWRNHGTAVIGEFGADDNSIGVIGICPEAEVSGISIFPNLGSSEAIRLAATRLRPGDIILIELHRAGGRNGFQERDDQLGYIPIEWWPDDFDAIRFATSRGIVVVEAGGNGAENLDDSLYDSAQEGFPDNWTNPFKRSNRDSGAIVVGAGAPPPGTHGHDHGPDRSRLDFSNYGESIDVQAWGREVTTCGYGDLQGGTNEDFWYTDEFSGTSSASPIVVGAVGCIQGILRSQGRPVLKPADVRKLLRATGSPQEDAPGRPKAQRIGNRPNLRQIILGLPGSVAAPRKERAVAPSKTRRRKSSKQAKPGKRKKRD